MENGRYWLTLLTSARPWSDRMLRLLAILVAVDAVKHAWLILVDSPTPQLDTVEYWQLAGRFLAGDWLWRESPIAYRTPGFPVFVMLFRAVLGSWAWSGLIIAQHVLAMLTALIGAALCGRVSRRPGLVVLAYAACLAGLTRDWHANLLLTETLFAFLTTAVLWAWATWWDRPGWRWAAVAGVLLGMASCVRPISCYLGFPLAAAMVVAAADRWRTARHAALMLSAAQIVLVPWYIRNERVFGEPFLTQFLGRNLWVVTFQSGAGAGLAAADGPATRELLARLPPGLPPSPQQIQVWKVSHALREQGMPDDDVDRLIRRTAWEAQLANPWRSAEQFARRAVNYWRCVSNPYPFFRWDMRQRDFEGQRRLSSAMATRWFEAISRARLSQSVAANGLLAAAAFAGAVRLTFLSRTRGAGSGLLLTLLYFSCVTAAIEIPAYRYRMFLEPLMVAAAVSGMGTWPPRIIRRSRPKAPSHRASIAANGPETAG